MLALSSGAHVLAFGAAPSPLPASIALLVCVQAAFLLTVKQRSLLSFVAGIAGVQLGLHAFFASTSHDTAHSLVPVGRMFLAHLVAGLLAGWWLRRGDQRLASMVAALTAGLWRVLLLLLLSRRAAPEVLVVLVTADTRGRARWTAARAVQRRGPPVRSVSLTLTTA